MRKALFGLSKFSDDQNLIAKVSGINLITGLEAGVEARRIFDRRH